ncbi:MAG TPA: hypothetical protein VK477_00865 [Acidobacteriota bacterium]|nr:hypothetical protein [Acidobacteriota bacterium]
MPVVFVFSCMVRRALFLLVVYLLLYPVLWRTRLEVIYAYTMDRGCIQKIREVTALRSVFLEQSFLRVPLTALYAPINAVRLSRSPWR